jgi:hypothetical protein
LTPVTPETFAVWKKTRVDKKIAESEAKEKAKAAARAAGKISGMSGKDLFDYSADMLQDEDEVRALFQLVITFGAPDVQRCCQDDEDEWDLQRYLASRDQDARQEDDDEGDPDDDRGSDGGGDEADGRSASGSTRTDKSETVANGIAKMTVAS